MATQAQRRAASRARLLDAAEALFVARGYAETSTEQVLQRAGMSRGGLYHHFSNKRELFEAVFLAVSEATIERAMRRGEPVASPIEGLIAVCLGWLHEVKQPAAAAILLDQGPLVLGWKRARDLEAKTSLGLMTRGLENAIAAGEIAVPSVSLAARFLNAALAEAALAMLHEADAVSDELIEASIRQWIGGLATH